MPRTNLEYSRTQVRNAGEYLRKLVAAEIPFDEDAEVEKLINAFAVLDNFRACHAYALSKATMGLRSRVDTVLCETIGPDHHKRLRVSQRLKRHASIVGKLARQRTMKLHKMQDIAGCRAVVDTPHQVRLIQRRWEGTKGRVKWVDDYMTDPKASGYRGVHVVVTYDGRLIEVQIRTEIQHEWAWTIERIGGRIGQDLKGGEGPREVLDFFRAVSEAMALEEAGEDVPDDLLERVKALRSTAEPMMKAER